MLYNSMLARKLLPIVTITIQPRLIDLWLRFILVLQEGKRKALGRMPANVAMHQPSTRIICLEGEKHIAAQRKHGDIAAREVVELSRRLRGVVWRVLLVEDEEVVTVQVNRMGLEKREQSQLPRLFNTSK